MRKAELIKNNMRKIITGSFISFMIISFASIIILGVLEAKREYEFQQKEWYSLCLQKTDNDNEFCSKVILYK